MKIWKVNVFLFLTLISSIFVAFKVKYLPILLICWFATLYSSHCLAHYIVGKLLGFEFSHYTLSKSMLHKVSPKIFSAKIFLTLRIKKKQTGWKCFFMFLSGSLASMFLPFSIAFISGNLIIMVLSVFNLVFTGYFSYKYGCIRKALSCLGQKS